MKDVRLFARLGDGSLRRAVRYRDAPGWIWMSARDDAQQFNGDIIISVPNADTLPHSQGELAIHLMYGSKP
jgi:hypothetical protein